MKEPRIPADTAPGARREVARRTRRLTTAQIVRAAQALPPGAVTMQAVADALGVDRKALHHHVVDKDGLLTLMAIDVLAARFAEVDLGDEPDWRDTVATFGRAIRASTTAAGALAAAFRVDALSDPRLLRPVEATLSRLVRAGASPELAGRLVTTLSTLAVASARDVLATEAGHASPHLEAVGEVLPDAPEDFPVLRWMVEHGVSAADDAQFEVDLRVFVAGAARLIDDGAAGAD